MGFLHCLLFDQCLFFLKFKKGIQFSERTGFGLPYLVNEHGINVGGLDCLGLFRNWF